MIETAKDRIMEPVRRVATSRKIILALFEATCNIKVAKDFEFGTNLEQFDFFAPIAGLRHSASTRIVPRSADGASRRVSRGASTGETTSAGAVNSQRTLHAAKATDDDGIPTLRRQRVGFIPRLCLPPSDSGISL